MTINRRNWLDVMEFLKYQDDVMLRKANTINRDRIFLRHLLEWADDRLLSSAYSIKPSFGLYLLTARNDGQEKRLAPATLKKCCDTARALFDFQKRAHPARYKSIKVDWVASIRPPRSAGMQSILKNHDFYSLEDMLKLAGAEIDSLAMERERAAACFLYLSGMRADAFVSLPISCVDLVKWEVRQLPELGVRTKFNKAAITYFLDILELRARVIEWDRKVRAALPAGAAWYARVNRTSDGFLPSADPGLWRREQLTRGLVQLCAAAGVKYLSPHKLRHGFAVYGVRNAQNMAELKAVSQNLMHSSLAITDGLYGNLAGDDVKSAISSLGRKADVDDPDDETAIMKALLRQLARDTEIVKQLLSK